MLFMALIGQAAVVKAAYRHVDNFVYVKDIRSVASTQEHNLETPEVAGHVCPCWRALRIEPPTHSVLL